jgi:chemotaxis signal transduction protein
MVFADHIADDAEKLLMKRLVVGLGFAVDQVDEVINKSLDAIQKGKDEEEFTFFISSFTLLINFFV